MNIQLPKCKLLEKVKHLGEQLYPCMEANQELQRLAFWHRQTQMANRRRFEAYVDQEWHCMAQKQASLSLILGDLDFFKAYNDTHGYQSGDQCLQKIAEAIMKAVMRPADFVPRYGGEEFIVILPHTNALDALRVAEDIQSEVKALKIAHAASQTSQYLTLSLGVVSIVPTIEYSSALLIAAAERALYHAKSQGRDRIISCENLLLQTPDVPDKTPALQENKGNSPGCAIETGNDETSKTELLISYVAYYVSRGKRIISPQRGALSFQKSVYQYWGYHRDFQEFWRELQQHRNFHDLYVEGDLYCFGQFLSGNCTVGECTRCNLPIPMTAGHKYDTTNCTLCLDPWLPHEEFAPPKQSLENQVGMTHVIAIGTPPTDCKNQEEWFALNGFTVSFVTKAEDLTGQSLSATIDLVLIHDSISEAEGKAWAQELSRYSQLQGVPIVALSAEAGQGLPWMNRTLGIADYVLTPYSGDRLARYLRQVLESQSNANLAALHWFPC
ncbi:MAG: GGDEF domain-containing protein [Coleofasciculus sp. S288]|nr:GGDEF domain-containing protein [Coleofasciculus sp. S288]